MVNVCDSCGRTYQRTYCEFCKRGARWWANKRDDFLRNTLTPRLKRFFSTYTMPVDQADVQALADGGGLALLGEVGAGKTTYAAAAALEVDRLRHVERKFLIPEPTASRFLATQDLLREFRETYQAGSAKTEGDLFDEYAQASLLILDDLTMIGVSDWSVSLLDGLVNARYESLRPTIVTTNRANLDSLAQALDDDRIASRMAETYRIRHFNGEDYRLEGLRG